MKGLKGGLEKPMGPRPSEAKGSQIAGVYSQSTWRWATEHVRLGCGSPVVTPIDRTQVACEAGGGWSPGQF